MYTISSARDLHPTARLASYDKFASYNETCSDKTCILRQDLHPIDLHPTTRLASYDKACILRQDLHPMTRLASYDKTCTQMQDTSCVEGQGTFCAEAQDVHMSQNHSFGNESGPHGSPQAHIKSGRSHKPQEPF